MKSFTKFFAVSACLLLLSLQSFASFPTSQTQCKGNACEKFKIGMYRIKGTLTMRLLLEKQKGETVQVTLRNSQGRVFYQEVVAKRMTRFGNDFIFEGSEDGKYTLEIANENEKIVKDIDLRTQDVQVVNNRVLVALN